jgi:hypothetical protein
LKAEAASLQAMHMFLFKAMKDLEVRASANNSKRRCHKFLDKWTCAFVFDQVYA